MNHYLSQKISNEVRDFTTTELTLYRCVIQVCQNIDASIKHDNAIAANHYLMQLSGIIMTASALELWSLRHAIVIAQDYYKAIGVNPFERFGN